ncbi:MULTISPECIES: ABC transporter substrate-binding protein [Geobacillus]|uniref:ABC transporter substrate-binding protein n=1 Tax=Geobacillus TaxID=129337 RepID=UPI0013FDDC06|nr:sugar ABC transporter substrate-binding protein [Geobacillus zalihae]
MKNKLFIIVAIMFLLTLTACGSQTGSSPSSSSEKKSQTEKIVIKWWDYHSPDPIQKAIKEMISSYEKEHPNIKIERTYIPFADLKNKLLMGAAAGQLPDIVMIDNPDHQAFAAAGILADITKEVKEWGEADQYFEGPWSSTMYKGKNYGVPNSSNNLALFYNVDMLKEAGIDPPKNWDELREAAKKLTKPGIYGFAVSGVKSEEGTFQFLPFVWQAGEDITNLNSKGTIEALSLWKYMVDNGYMSKEIITQRQQDIAVQFAAGKIAMMVNGTWQIPFLESEAKVKWDVVTLPVYKQGGTILGGENWAITASSKHRDIAWDIIKYAQKPENLKKFLQAAGRLPSRKDLIQDPFWQEDKHLKVFADGMKVAKARAYGPNYPKISEAIQEMIQQVITGAKTPEDAVKEADNKIESLLP